MKMPCITRELVIGVPFRRRKCNGGAEVARVGYSVDIETNILGIRGKCASWIYRWIETPLLQARSGCMTLLRSG